MLPRNLVAVLVALSPTLVYAQDPEAPGEEEDLAEAYAKAGNLEIGGSLGASFDSDEMTLTATPSIGYFAFDRVELSLALTLTYTRSEDDLTDMTTSSKSGAVIFEPSYHHPITDNLLILGGLGVGPGYDGDHVELDVIPRVGVNIVTSRASVITPSVRLPIKIGKSHGEMGDVGTDVGLLIDVGITTVW